MAAKNGGKQAQPAKQERQRPAHEVRIGRLRATLWKNEHPEQGAWYSVTLTRSYKDSNGQWKSAGSLGRDDLLVAGEVLRQAFHWIHRQNNTGGGSTTEGAQEEPADSTDVPF